MHIYIGHENRRNTRCKDLGNDLIAICIKLAGINMGVCIDQLHLKAGLWGHLSLKNKKVYMQYPERNRLV